MVAEYCWLLILYEKRFHSCYTYSFHCQLYVLCFCLVACAPGKGIWLLPVERLLLDAVWPPACGLQSRLHAGRSKSQHQLLHSPSFPLDLVKEISRVRPDCTFSTEHVGSTSNWNRSDNQGIFLFPFLQQFEFWLCHAQVRQGFRGVQNDPGE